MSTPGSPNFFISIRDSILMGVHQYKYKNGAFTDKIFRETPVVDAFTILIGSAETTTAEKSTLKAMRKLCITSLNRGSAPGFEAIVKCGADFLAFSDLFQNDAKARGMYVPPFFTKTMNDNGIVKETHVLNDDGTKSVFKGSVAGVPPGAPDEFVKAQAKNASMLSSAIKDDPAWIFLGNQFTLDAIPSAPKNETLGSESEC
jgi:hypothetical protein